MNPKMLANLVNMALTKLTQVGEVRVSKQDLPLGFWFCGTIRTHNPKDQLTFIEISAENHGESITLKATVKEITSKEPKKIGTV